MNVIFLDFDGVLFTTHGSTDIDLERRIITLAEMCKEFDCKIVIEAAAKEAMDYETLEVKVGTAVYKILKLFEKYGITCVGRTPTIGRQISKYVYTPIWKEDEIIAYLEEHPEIEHYCVIDDDDRKVSDLDKVRDHLVQTIYYSDNYEEEGLLPRHKEEIRKILEKENKISLRRK